MSLPATPIKAAVDVLLRIVVKGERERSAPPRMSQVLALHR